MKPKRMIFFPLLFMLLSAVIIALAYSQPNIFALRYAGSGSGNGDTVNSSGSISEILEDNGLTDTNDEGGFQGGFSMNFMQPAQTVWASDALGNDKEVFEPSDSVFASVQAAGQTVTFYVTAHHETWVDGNVLADVSGGAEHVTLNPSGVQTVEVWVPLLVSGSYDVVLDANNNGVFDSGVDCADVVHVQLSNVIPEVPFGTVITSISMIVGAIGFAGYKRFHYKLKP